MRLTKRSENKRVLPMEITPMIDVVFLLIIFFMVTAQFARMTRADIDLPREAGERTLIEEGGMIINVSRADEIIVNEQIVDLDQLVAIILEHQEQDDSPLKLLLRADREANAMRLNEVITHMQRAGISAARIATEVP